MTSLLMSEPLFEKKPNLIIIHTRTNDIQNNLSTSIIQKIRKKSSSKECDTDDNLKIAFSSIIHPNGHDFEDKINVKVRI